MASDALEKRDDGTLAFHTPPDPCTGTTLLVLDPLEWIHRITSHIPDQGQHSVRYDGAYSNRGRVAARAVQDFPEASAPAQQPDEDSEFAKDARTTWSRLLRKIFEVDPLLCSCGGRMKVVSVITEPQVIDLVLRHVQNSSCRARDPFEPRSPPPHPRALQN